MRIGHGQKPCCIKLFGFTKGWAAQVPGVWTPRGHPGRSAHMPLRGRGSTAQTHGVLSKLRDAHWILKQPQLTSVVLPGITHKVGSSSKRPRFPREPLRSRAKEIQPKKTPNTFPTISTLLPPLRKRCNDSKSHERKKKPDSWVSTMRYTPRRPPHTHSENRPLCQDMWEKLCLGCLFWDVYNGVYNVTVPYNSSHKRTLWEDEVNG